MASDTLTVLPLCLQSSRCYVLDKHFVYFLSFIMITSASSKSQEGRFTFSDIYRVFAIRFRMKKIPHSLIDLVFRFWK